MLDGIADRDGASATWDTQCDPAPGHYRSLIEQLGPLHHRSSAVAPRRQTLRTTLRRPPVSDRMAAFAVHQRRMLTAVCPSTPNPPHRLA